MNWFPKFMSVVILQSTKKTPVLEAVRIIKSDPKRCVLRFYGTPPYCYVLSTKMNNKIKNYFIKLIFSFPKLLPHSTVQ